MQPYRLHVFACDQQKAEGVPCCSARGSAKVLEVLRREVGARGLANDVQVTACGSLGLCEHGPNIVVYPEGTWYSGVSEGDVPEIVESHFINGTPVARLMRTSEPEVKAEITGNREKYLAAMKARDEAGVLPDDLNDRIRGFWDSRAILTALELDIFNEIGEGASASHVATRAGSDARATEMLMNALESLGLLLKNGDVYRNTPAVARYFTAGSKDDARPALLHTAHLWHRWSTLTDAVKAGTRVTGESRDEDWTESFIAAMHRNASDRAPLVVRTVGVDGVRRMLDIGGGSGAYTIAFAKANHAMSVDLLDRAEVLTIAKRHVEAAGVGARVRFLPGDLRIDALGQGYDLILLSAICHMLSGAENLDLLKRCRSALTPGGRLVIQDFILDDDKTRPRFAAMFSLNMLVGTEGGASYSGSEYASWLEDADFSEVRRVTLPGITGLVVGTV